VADHRDVMKLERLDDGGEIVGVAVHVVARRRLAGTAVATPVVSVGAAPANATQTGDRVGLLVCGPAWVLHGLGSPGL
jgi:hypothetical protein